MVSIRLVLAATDFSPEGNNAVWRAAAMARHSGARLGIVHVVDPAGYQALRDWRLPCHQLELEAARGRAQLRQLAIDVARDCDLMPSVHLQEGDVVDELVRTAASADLLVLGRPPKRRFRDLLMTRTADRVLRASRRPVLVARNPVKGHYSTVLVPLDFSACSGAALRFAMQFAPAKALRLFHALDPAGETIMREAEVPVGVVRDIRAREDVAILGRMRRHVARLGMDDRVVRFAVGRGKFTNATAEHARHQDAELIVVTRRPRWSLGNLLRANVGTGLLRSSSCDLLMLPHVVDVQAQSRAALVRLSSAAEHGVGRHTGAPEWSAGVGASKRDDGHFNWLGRA